VVPSIHEVVKAARLHQKSDAGVKRNRHLPETNTATFCPLGVEPTLGGSAESRGSTGRPVAADADVPTAPERDAQNRGKAAQAYVGKTAMRLADQVKKFVP
jgi:hypothetical protein